MNFLRYNKKRPKNSKTRNTVLDTKNFVFELRALRALVPYVPLALRALVPHVLRALRALAPTCSCAPRASCPTYSRASRTSFPLYSRASRASSSTCSRAQLVSCSAYFYLVPNVFSCLTCLTCCYTSHVLYLACSRAACVSNSICSCPPHSSLASSVSTLVPFVLLLL